MHFAQWGLFIAAPCSESIVVGAVYNFLTCSGSDDVSIAESLRQNVRVLCWVMTTPENHMSRAVHVQATWGRRCNVLLFVTEKDDVGALSVMKVDVKTGREHLTAKTMSAFDHLYEHHRHEADWFLKVSHSSFEGQGMSTDKMSGVWA